MTVGFTIEQVRPKILELARRIDAPESYLPKFGFTNEGTSIEPRGGGLAYMVRERGEVYTDWWVSAEDELFYWVFRDVTSTMAGDWEARHRIEGEDSRRGRFKKQLELMHALSPAWEQQLRRELARYLRAVGLA
jgi:hypothetical protein